MTDRAPFHTAALLRLLFADEPEAGIDPHASVFLVNDPMTRAVDSDPGGWGTRHRSAPLWLDVFRVIAGDP